MHARSIALSFLLAACSSEEASAPPPPLPPAGDTKTTAVSEKSPASAPATPTPAPVEAPKGGCSLLSVPIPVHRGAGKAHIKLSGALNAEGAEQPAVCGAYWALDQNILGKPVKAGDGLLFEACLPEGLFQISADDVETGKRNLAITDSKKRTRILFNPRGGGSYVMMRPGAGDSLIVDKDRRTAKGSATLKSFAGGDDLRVEFDLDCR